MYVRRSAPQGNVQIMITTDTEKVLAKDAAYMHTEYIRMYVYIVMLLSV